MASSSTSSTPGPDDALAAVVDEIRGCRICRDAPDGTPLPHEPRPVLRVSATARIGVFGQAPGTRVHASGIPFTDPSGERLRRWMGVTDEVFYDASRIAVVPMGFCFPGLDAKGGDRPPRRECAPSWRPRLMRHLPNLDMVLLVGQYAVRWHLPDQRGRSLTDVVANWRQIAGREGPTTYVPLPHPSWRNNAWLGRHRWFDAELVPWLQTEIRQRLAAPGRH